MNSEAGQGKIIADGIFRTPPGKSVCDLFRRFPIRRTARGQAEFTRQTVHVSIQRNNQTAGGNGIPAARVDLILPHQPPEHQMETLACTSPFRRRKKGRFPVRKKAAELFRKMFRGRQNRPVGGGKSGEKALFQRTVPFNRPSGAPAEKSKIRSCVKTMFETGKIALELFRRRIQQICPGREQHNSKDAADAFQNLVHPSVGERRGQQSGDLAVFDALER